MLLRKVLVVYALLAHQNSTVLRFSKKILLELTDHSINDHCSDGSLS